MFVTFVVGGCPTSITASVLVSKMNRTRRCTSTEGLPVRVVGRISPGEHEDVAVLEEQVCEVPEVLVTRSSGTPIDPLPVERGVAVEVRGVLDDQVQGEFVGGTCGNSAELVESLGEPKCDDIESRTERGDEPLVDVGSGDGRELFKPHLGPALPEGDPQPRSHTRRQRAGAVQRGEVGLVGHAPIVRDRSD